MAAAATAIGVVDKGVFCKAIAVAADADGIRGDSTSFLRIAIVGCNNEEEAGVEEVEGIEEEEEMNLPLFFCMEICILWLL